MRTPKACRRCGQALKRDTMGHGYDAFTGERNPLSEVLRCPFTGPLSTSRHDYWILNHNILFGDHWVDGNTDG